LDKERPVNERDIAPQTPQRMTPAQALDMAVALHRQGRLGEAERVYRAILKLKPDDFAALHYLGMIATQQGRQQEAEGLIRQALTINPDSAQAHNDLGIALAELGRHEEALTEYERAVLLDPANVEARNNLGNALHTLGRSGDAVIQFAQALAVRPDVADIHNNLGNALAGLRREQEAVASFHNAIRIRPDFAEAHNNLGFVLAALQDFEGAAAAYERAIALRPHYFEAHDNLVNAFAALRRYEDAIPHFESALAIRPRAATTLNNFGNVLAALKRYPDALSHYRMAIEIKADFFEAHNNLGNTLAALDRHQEALAFYERALAANPEAGDAHCNLGNSLAALGRHDDALACYGKAISVNPELAEAHASLGNELRTMGRLEESRLALEKAVEIAPHHAEFHRSLAESKKFFAGDPQLAVMEALAADMTSRSEDERIALHFALGKAYGDCGEHENSFRHLFAGNTLKRRQIHYDEAGAFARFERLKAVFTPELIQEKRGLGAPSELPIFIFGMPRSGTTLVEQVLASHPKVTGGGELEHFGQAVGRLEREFCPGKAFPEIVTLMGAKELCDLSADYLSTLRSIVPVTERLTDKMPGNFAMAGIIHLALPRARLIHVRRNPIDTCLSCFSKSFVGDIPFSYDLAELGRYYRAYEDLMSHWRDVLPAESLLEVQYEEFVTNFESQARRLLAHCGLDWDDRCLSFHQTQRTIRTASAVQVRQPLYRRAIGSSRPYEPWLGPLFDALGSR
jgi:tetratricopeptide (TPR) repeat protein